jgi:hypothetical protein
MPTLVDEKVLIPDLLRQAPQVRPVLDRYGLRGCGGPLGPRESLGFFARAHDVPLSRLLAELRSSLNLPAAESVSDPLADTIYRPFFKAGIATTLTLGAAWGAYLLLRIAATGSFTAASLHEVNAHGHAQIFGWVGLVVMGFAYQAFPRFKHTTLSCPRLALASGAMLVTGLIARSFLEPLADHVSWLALPAVLASVLEVIAIMLFAGIVIAIWKSSGKPLAAYDYYILSALGWFVIQAVFESIYLAATLGPLPRDQLLARVATWQAPLRDIQIHGFALILILGVSQRVFHYFYGLPASSPRRSLAMLVCLNASVLSEVFGLVAMRLAGHAWAGLWFAGVLLLAGSSAVLVSGWHIFSRPLETDRSLKYLRAAYIWLFVSLAMLVLLPLYQFGVLPALAPESQAAHMGFSHAYYGAIRHAATVGFISLMIMGVAAKVVPTLKGLDLRALPGLWLPFVLINLGCATRVVTQTLTDFSARSFPFAGMSGLLEVAGLTLWGVSLWRIMNGKGTAIPVEVEASSLREGSPITGDHRVGEVLDRYPQTLETFLAFGFQPLANPWLRRTVARHVTLERACRLVDVDLQELLSALNRQCSQAETASRMTLPMALI